MNAPVLSLQAMRETADRLAPHVLRTPVTPLHGRYTEALLPGPSSVTLKLELMQRTGTFKARGALNAVLGLTPEQRARGITAASAGNHAIAAAFAAKAAGTSAKIAVQASANPVRLALARAYGAELLVVPDGAAAFATAEALVRDEGRAMIHPFDGVLTSLGTATIGLELVEQAPDVEVVVVAIGGGGLASGVAAAVKSLRPQCRVFGVEPVGADAMRRSFETGSPVRLPAVNTIADSLGPPMTLPYSFGLCRRYVDDVVTVDDDEICRALAVLFHDAKLAVEPAGAAALAAALRPLHTEVTGRRVALIVCGANIDREGFCTFLARGEAQFA